MGKIIVLGAGIFTDEILDILNLGGDYEVIAFVEGINREKCNKKKDGIPVIWIDDIEKLDKKIKCICSIGSPKRKGIINETEKKGFKFTSVFHPTSQIFPSAFVGKGSMIGAGSIIAARSKIGNHVIMNRGCLIGHHVQIDNYVTVSPGANIAGKVVIKEGAYIGMGSNVIDGIRIGKNSIIGAGSVVTKDVPDNVQVMGIPARITKEFKN